MSQLHQEKQTSFMSTIPRVINGGFHFDNEEVDNEVRTSWHGEPASRNLSQSVPFVGKCHIEVFLLGF